VPDFQPYQPQLGAPTAWLATPVGTDGKIEGVMALQLPIAKLNRIMTAGKHWVAAGLGQSTETYLVGPDNLMRSDSRLFLEDPQAYRREAIDAGTPPNVVNKAIRLGEYRALLKRAVQRVFSGQFTKPHELAVNCGILTPGKPQVSGPCGQAHSEPSGNGRHAAGPL
jgi:hypothetical protein